MKAETRNVAGKPDVHSRTQAARTTTPEVGQATPSKVPPPTAAQTQAQQRADTERSKQPAAPANDGTAMVPALPAPTAEERAQLIARNIAKLGGRGAAVSVTFHGVNGNFPRSDGADLPIGTLAVVGVRDFLAGYCSFRNSYEEVMRRIDEVQVEREDLDGGWDEEPGMDGQPRLVWQPQATVPIILTEDGHEMLTLVCRNSVSRIALDGLVSNCYAHPLFKRGLLPIVEMRTGTYINKKLGGVKKPKPIFRVAGWVNTDGSPADARLAAPQQGDRITSGKSLPAEMGDEIPFE
jgi:hypothetical protein